MSTWIWIIYLVPLAVLAGWQLGRRRRLALEGGWAQRESLQSGAGEPVSLHPVVDSARCVGCGECVKACPERESRVLSLIDGKAELMNPGDCIGHGACRTSCPVGAITLVFGTATRGVELPVLSADFETSIPGIFVAGELGGMGLIRNALAQGAQAAQAVASRGRRRQSMADILIVGAGPAGFAASLTAKSLGMRYVTIEQESLGGCVYQYPRAKVVVTSPVEVPLIGTVRITETSKEALLEFWRDVERRTGVEIHYGERVESVAPRNGGLVVRTTRARYAASAVLLATGRRGSPRKLGVPGEELPKVVYGLVDPEQYAGQRVLVVGGGDSALESAASIAESTDATVAICYRGESFVRAKSRNRQRIELARRAGRLHVLLKSQVRRIVADAVILEKAGRLLRIPNEAVIVAAGGIVPTEFLRNVGIELQTKFGTA